MLPSPACLSAVRRPFGYVCDQLAEVECVLADESVVVANASLTILLMGGKANRIDPNDAVVPARDGVVTWFHRGALWNEQPLEVQSLAFDIGGLFRSIRWCESRALRPGSRKRQNRSAEDRRALQLQRQTFSAQRRADYSPADAPRRSADLDGLVDAAWAPPRRPPG